MLEKRFIVREEKSEDLFDRINATIWFLRNQGRNAFTTDNTDLGLPSPVVCERQNVINKNIRLLVNALSKIAVMGFFTDKEADKVCALVGLPDAGEYFEEIR